MTWRIEIVKANPEEVTTHDLLISFLAAQSYWRRLSKASREAVAHAYQTGGPVVGHPLTLAALKRHGFTHCGSDTDYEVRLTTAGLAVARICIKANAA